MCFRFYDQNALIHNPRALNVRCDGGFGDLFDMLCEFDPEMRVKSFKNHLGRQFADFIHELDIPHDMDFMDCNLISGGGFFGGGLKVRIEYQKEHRGIHPFLFLSVSRDPDDILKIVQFYFRDYVVK